MDDDVESERQFELWKGHAANHMLQAAHALMEALNYAAEGEEVAPFINTSSFLLQEAEILLPPGEQWPELPDNVVPITKAMRHR